MKSLTPHQSKVLDTSGHISLTANAGSGKTFILAKRYIEIALHNDIDLRNIAAITFTDRAAGELYQKISLEIEERIGYTEDKHLLQQLHKIRRELVSANISTIHSFCISILKEYPIEAGVDAEFIPVDDNISGELIDISIEEMVKTSLESKNNEDVKELIRLLGSKFIFTQELKLLIRNYRTIVLLNDKIYSSTEDKISEYLSKTFEEYRDKILKDKISDILNALKIINDTVLNIDSRNDKALEIKSILESLNTSIPTDELLNYLNTIKIINSVKAGTICKKGYLKGSLREDIETSCSFIEGFYKNMDNLIRHDDYRERENILASIGKKIITFVEDAFRLYEDKKFERGYLDYEDILLKTYYILSDENVRSELSEKFKFIMIDEYQDTNELQYRIFLPIIDFLKKGNLFIVGDEKQSIYMFRDADLAVFRKTKDNIEKASGKENLLVLPDSFRMKKEIAFFANTLFENLFSSPDPVFNEVDHNNIICAKEDDDILGKVEILLSDKEEEGSLSEADLVALKILQLKSKGELFGNIAVLCRKRKSFAELEESFSEKEIPYNIIGGREFYQRQSIYDICNYFSFLLSEGDDTALTGILRSPFFFLTDVEIFNISKQEGWTLWGKLKNAASGNEKLNKIYITLADNLSLAHTSEFIYLLRKILSESGFLAVLASRPDGVQECANIEKLISLTATFNAQGYKTLYDYVEFLISSINEVDNEPQAVITEGNDVVKIMTVHQSKGLEFNIVILFKCNERTKKDSVKTKSLTADKEFGIITKFPQNNNYFEEYCTAPIAGLFNYISAKKNTAELKRLFYVAITRAKTNLFLSGEASKTDKYNNDSFFGLLLTGLNTSLTEEQINLNGYIEMLTFNKNIPVEKKVEISLTIPVIKNINKIDAFTLHKSIEQKTYKTDIIPGNLSDEILSATKYSTYSLCPVKYYLLFEAGLIPLIDMDEVETYELRKTNPDSSFKRDTAALRGRIIHKLLELSLSEEEIQEYLTSALKTEDFETDQKLHFSSEIIAEIKNIYSFPFYKEITTAPKFRNEHEIYLREKDFILFGRIDKVIFEENRIRIIDYKTDNIKRADIENRSKKYLYQLKFYSYILSKIFPEVAEFTITILFTRFPGNPYSKNICKDELSVTEAELEEMIMSVRQGSYVRKNHHCSECSFFVNKICLKDKI